MAQSDIDQHLMLQIPDHLKIYELTTTGPHQKSNANLTAIEEKKDIVWFHIMKEEYDQIQGGIEFHPEDHDGSIGLKIPSQVASKLRYPWLHGSLFEHHAHAIFHTSWLMSENRVATAHPKTSFLVSYKPSLWRMHDYIMNNKVNCWSRHNTSRSIQVLEGNYDLDDQEQASARIFQVDGSIPEIFDHINWSKGFLWAYHVPFKTSVLEADASIENFQQSIKDAMHHAGLHLLTPLSAENYNLLLKACIKLGISIKAPMNKDGARYRGHIDHAKYIMKNMEESIKDFPPKSPSSRPCVPRHQDDITMPQAIDIDMEEDPTIENEDGTITVPIHMVSINP